MPPALSMRPATPWAGAAATATSPIARPMEARAAQAFPGGRAKPGEHRHHRPGRQHRIRQRSLRAGHRLRARRGARPQSAHAQFGQDAEGDLRGSVGSPDRRPILERRIHQPAQGRQRIRRVRHHRADPREPDGRITHYVAVKEDITEKKRMAEELDRHRHHLEALVEERTAQLAAGARRGPKPPAWPRARSWPT